MLHGRDPVGSRQFSRVVNRHSREYVRRALRIMLAQDLTGSEFALAIVTSEIRHCLGY